MSGRDHMQTQETATDQQAFEEAMTGFQQRIDGHFGVMALNIDSGLELTWNHEDVFPTASTMKVQLLYTLYRLAEDGEIDLSARVPLRRDERVPGSGVLQHLDEGLEPTVRDLAELMIIVSDNYATDLIYGMIGHDRLAASIRELGLRNTHLPHTTWQILAQMAGIDPDDDSLVYDDLREALKGSASDEDGLASTGSEEYDRSTPADMVRTMSLIEEGYGLSDESRTAIVETLKHQNFTTRIPGRLPEGVGIEVAHKTGSVRGVRNDVGIVYGPGIRYAIAIMSRDLQDPAEAVDQFARMSRWIWDHLSA